MNDEALSRYSRHLLLNEWGIEAQSKLNAAKVLIIGAGGLGCPAAQTLAAAGVGFLTIADGDVVDATNLMRQTLHTTDRIGLNKALSAQAALHTVNPLCTVVPITNKLLGTALSEAICRHDVVLDCSDHFATRHAVNRACVAAKKPLFSAAAIRFDGQLIAFDSNSARSACYHCLFPEHGSDDDSDRCGVMGVYAPLTQHMGVMQASAALRFMTGVGQVTLSQLRIFNALTDKQQYINIPKDPACMVCGERT